MMTRIAALARLVENRASSRGNPIYDIFGIEPRWDGALCPLPPMDEAVEVHLRELPAQTRVVAAFKKARTYYDAGHRHFDDTLHDRLIDDIFATYDARVIAKLLCDLGSDELHPDFDGLDGLFVPAFAGLAKLVGGRKAEAKLVKAWRAYRADGGDYFGGAYFDKLARAIGKKAKGIADKL